MSSESIVEPLAFRALVDAYARPRGVSLVAVTLDGEVIECADAWGRACDDSCDTWRAKVVREAWRWGEPSVFSCPHDQLQWAVPLMHNQVMLGGVLAGMSMDRAFVATADGDAVDVREACRELRLTAERLNLTNAAALAEQRRLTREEQQRAYALHSYKRRRHVSIRELYLHEEPALLAAIRSADADEAHAVLERITVAIRYYAEQRPETVKGYYMELVVTMGRAAVEAGGKPDTVFGATYTNTVGLAKVETAGDLHVWLRCMLDIALDAVRHRRANEPMPVVARAITYLEKHVHDDLGRDGLAKAVGVSPGRLSHLIRQETGATFTELFNRTRIDRAAALLTGSRRSLGEIALACGFNDQTYFTKVFKRYRKCTPLRFRKDYSTGHEACP